MLVSDGFDNNHIEELMEEGLSNIKNMITTQTVVGDAVDMGKGCFAYPVVKLTVGLVCGGGEYSAKKLSKKATRFPFAGGSGTGFSAEPVGFLINNNGNVTFSTIESKNVAGEILKKLSDAMAKYIENLSKNKQNKE